MKEELQSPISTEPTQPEKPARRKFLSGAAAAGTVGVAAAGFPMIAVAQFISLPLLFFSSLLIARTLIPGWMQTFSLLNPVEWAVRAGRGEAPPGTDLAEVGAILLLLVGFLALTTTFATRIFRSYQCTL